MEKKWKKTVIQGIICVGLVVLIWTGYFVERGKLVEKKRIESVVSQNVSVDNKLLFEIEKVEERGNGVNFIGWACYPDGKNNEIALTLRKVGETKEHILLADLFEKEGITEYFLLNGTSGKQGFDAEISKKELDKDSCYEIFLFLDYQKNNSGVIDKSKKKVSTGVYYYDGNLYSYNPKEFQKPRISSKELVDVIENGKMRFYDPKDGIWVYQSDVKLYLLVDTNKNCVTRETNIVIPVMPSTSCVQLLSENRQQYGNDHLGAYYADERYIEEFVQVIEVELPTDYPMTYVMTGLYDDENNEWKKLITLPMFDWRMCGSK